MVRFRGLSEEVGTRGEPGSGSEGEGLPSCEPQGAEPGTPKVERPVKREEAGTLTRSGVGYLFGLSYLVDPASSHMLVSKIKPCMCKYKLILYCETANGSLNQL